VLIYIDHQKKLTFIPTFPLGITPQSPVGCPDKDKQSDTFKFAYNFKSDAASTALTTAWLFNYTYLTLLLVQGF
jgi:hypothetical protein